MGHPDVDPHGDPIPERDGELRPAGGTPLSAWPVAAPGRIVHLEDEPPLAYAQIAAVGLRLGQLVHIVEASPTRIVLSDGESEFTLAPMLAGNVHVAAAAADARGREPNPWCGSPTCRPARWARWCHSIPAARASSGAACSISASRRARTCGPT